MGKLVSFGPTCQLSCARCLASTMAPASKDGVFNPACFIHTGFTNKILINGVGAFKSH